MLFALLALLAAQEAPAALDLKAGGTIEYARSMSVTLALDAGEKGKAESRISMDAGYRFDVKPAEEGCLFQMKFIRAKLENTVPGRPTATWELPADPPIEGRVRTDRSGRVSETSLVMGEFQPAGRLRKIPLVYFWSQDATATGRGGPFASGPGLPGKPATEWTFTDEHSYGPTGLLDDFSRFRETWKAVVKKAEGGVLECELTLQDVALVESFRKQTIEIKDRQGKGSCRIDAKTGLTLASESDHTFTFSVKVKDVEAKGTISRSEKLEKK